MVCGCYLPAAGQQDTGTTLTEISADTTLNKPKKLRKAMEELGERAKGNNIQRYKEGRNAMRQADIIDQIKRITLQASDFEKTSIDTAAIWNELHDIDSLFDLAGDGIFTKAGTIQTHRNLNHFLSGSSVYCWTNQHKEKKSWMNIEKSWQVISSGLIH